MLRREGVPASVSKSRRDHRTADSPSHLLLGSVGGCAELMGSLENPTAQTGNRQKKGQCPLSIVVTVVLTWRPPGSVRVLTAVRTGAPGERSRSLSPAWRSRTLRAWSRGSCGAGQARSSLWDGCVV